MGKHLSLQRDGPRFRSAHTNTRLEKDLMDRMKLTYSIFKKQKNV